MPRFNHVQHRVKNMAPSCKALPAVVTLDLFTPVPVPLPPKPAAASNTEGKSKEGSPGTPEADRTPTGANGGAEPSTNNHKKDKKKKDKKKKKEGRENANGEAPPPAAAAGGADGVDGAKAGVGGSSAAEAQASTAEPAAAQGDPSKLDVRVGVIVKAWEHPDSDKLFCEEIDLGEVCGLAGLGGWLRFRRDSIVGRGCLLADRGVGSPLSDVTRLARRCYREIPHL